jgi:hypothetical protein
MLDTRGGSTSQVVERSCCIVVEKGLALGARMRGYNRNARLPCPEPVVTSQDCFRALVSY